MEAMRFSAFIAVILLLAGCAAAPSVRPQPSGGSVTKAAVEPPAQDATAQLKLGPLFDRWVKEIKEDPQEALLSYKEVLLLAPELWQTHYNAGVLYLKLDQTQRAEEEFFAALKKGAPQELVYGSLGTVYHKERKADEAILVFKKAVRHDKDVSDLINLGNAYLLSGRTGEAVSLYREAEIMEPENMALAYNMGIAFYTTGDYEAARVRFEKALAGANGRGARIGLAQTLVRLGEYGHAAGLFRDAVDKDAPTPAIFKDMGIIYELYTGEMDKALESYALYLSLRKDEEVNTWMEVVKALSKAKADAP